MKQKKVRVNEFTSGLIVKNSHADLFFAVMVVILEIIGLMFLLSASTPEALTYEPDKNGVVDEYSLIKKQLDIVVVCNIIGLFASRFNYQKLRYVSNLGYVVSFALVVLAAKAGGGEEEINRDIGFFQPSEVAKFAIILFIAAGMDRDYKKTLSNKPYKGHIFGYLYQLTNGKIRITKSTINLFYYGIAVVAMAVAVYGGSHLSGAILIMLIGVSMLWLCEGKARWFVVGIIVVAVLLFIAINFYDSLPIKEYMKRRIELWIDKGSEPTEGRWQTNNSLYALGSGGFFGVGFGEGKQKHHFVAESHTDFIFSVVGEEAGFLGCMIIIILFAILIARGIYIGLHSNSRFGALLTFGIMMHIGIQTAVNIAVITDLFPNTGVPLPFFSYGGSAGVMTLCEMFIVLCVSRQADIPVVFSMRESFASVLGGKGKNKRVSTGKKSAEKTKQTTEEA